MKKLIFLLTLAVALAGFVSANTACQSGNKFLDMALTGYGVQEAAVTPDTVSAVIELPEGFLALPDTLESAGMPQYAYRIIKPIETGQAAVSAMREAGYWLRL